MGNWKSAGILLCFLLAMGAPAEAEWIGSWQMSPTRSADATVEAARRNAGTFRYRLHQTVAGREIRLRFTNEYGVSPLVVGGVTVGLASENSDIRAASLRRVTFDGLRNVIIPVGAPMVTDPVAIPVSRGDDLVISIYLPDGGNFSDLSSIPTLFVPDVDSTERLELKETKDIYARSPLSGIEVNADKKAQVIVALGDSITDGPKVVASANSAMRGWPELLARRLAESGGRQAAVLNAGIAGNRILRETAQYGVSALARFDRDVLGVPKVTHLIVLEGINDIGLSGGAEATILHNKDAMNDPVMTVAALIGGYKQFITRAHSHGIKVIGATITPFEGALYYSQEKEAVRQGVNHWIRTSGAYDGVVDFDAAVRDPAHPSRLLAKFDPGDHIHASWNRAGMDAMVAAFDLRLFK